MISSAMRRASLVAAVASVPVLLASPLPATTWYVPSQCPTIQAGVDSAALGDTVEVACGTYTWSSEGTGTINGLVELKSGLYLRGETGEPQDVTIDAEHQGRVFDCSPVDSTTSIVGFTITCGQAPAGEAGGAVYCQNSSIRISNCTFTRNQSDAFGGAIYIWINSAPTLSECEFSNNTTAGWGGAIALHGSHVIITRCVFRSNSADRGGAIRCCYLSWLDLDTCEFSGNNANLAGALLVSDSHLSATSCLVDNNYATQSGGALLLQNTDFELSSWTITRNSAQDRGGGIYAHHASLGVLTQIILHGDSAPNGSEIHALDSGTQITLACCDIDTCPGWFVGEGTIVLEDSDFSADPRFCDPDNMDFTLAGDSPCLPGNHPAGHECGLIGALEQGCGPVNRALETWAKIKSHYR